MRVLLTSSPGVSHIWSLVPFGWALRSLGHDVRLACLPASAPTALGTGLTPLLVGQDVEIPADAIPPPGAGRREQLTAFGRINAQLSGRLARGVLDTGLDFDLVVHETADLAGPLLAQRWGVPSVHLGWGAPPTDLVVRTLDTAGRKLRERFRLDPDPDPAALYVDVCPPSFGLTQSIAPAQPLRFVPFSGPGELPPWAWQPRERPRVLVTLGTVLLQLGGAAMLRSMVETLTDLDVELVVPIRGGADSVGGLPDHAQVVDWAPLSAVGAHCDLVVHQGGPGTVFTLFHQGVAQVATPVRIDEFRTTELMVGAGCGIRVDVDPLGATSDGLEALRDGVVAMLGDGAPTQATARVAAEIAAMPAPADAAAAALGRLGLT